jgi:branched-chain amino acid transport system ATP-binding protein
VTDLLACHDLHVTYGGVTAVRDVSLRVEHGQVVTLLGRNGAGKSSTLRALAGVTPYASGQVFAFGAALPAREPTHRLARRGVRLIPEERGLFASLTTAENLRICRGRPDAVAEILDLLPELRPLLKRQVGLMSGGEQQMLAVGAALASRPRVLLIDELSLGLAPIIVSKLLPVLRRAATDSGVGVLLVEQHVELALGISDHTYVMNKGEIVDEGSSEQFLQQPERLRASYLPPSSNPDCPVGHNSRIDYQEK